MFLFLSFMFFLLQNWRTGSKGQGVEFFTMARDEAMEGVGG
jgi:hypothetical protein